MSSNPQTLSYFFLGIRVTVTNPSELNVSLKGKSGTVKRRHYKDHNSHSELCWVRFDEDIPSELREYPDDDYRKNEVALFPHECCKEIDYRNAISQ